MPETCTDCGLMSERGQAACRTMGCPAEMRMRELHHVETEQENAALRAALIRAKDRARYDKETER